MLGLLAAFPSSVTAMPRENIVGRSGWNVSADTPADAELLAHLTFGRQLLSTRRCGAPIMRRDLPGNLLVGPRNSDRRELHEFS
jgi:hypothetical protein